jgi:hypothetical protein
MNRRDALRTIVGAALTPLALMGSETPNPLPASPSSRMDTSPPRSPLARVRVHAGGHHLQLEDGRPFFWLGDTAWQLLHDTTREECSYYLRTRARQGFTVIQAVVLTEFDGLNLPNEFGDRPLFDNDPGKPNPAYFKRVLEIVDEAAGEGLYVALVPCWGDKLTAPWGSGPRIFTGDNLPAAREYGRFIGDLMRERSNVLWLLGGDRPARLKGMRNEYLAKMARDAGFPADQDWTPIWREIAAGLREGVGREPLIVFHPQGGEESSSLFLHQEPWLKVNGMQSGHGGGHDVPMWKWIARDYALEPAKPTLDLEPNYEDHPYNPWPRWDPATGYFRDHDVRKQTYRSVFAGGCGVTYGHQAVWQFAGPRREVINYADRDWRDALFRPAGRQMQHLRALIESRPYFVRMPDQALLIGDPGEGGLHLQATRDAAGTYAFIYFPMNDQTATVDLGLLSDSRIRAWWFDPRTGLGTLQGEIDGAGHQSFRSPPYGPDWVLVLDVVSAGYRPPGLGVGAG